MIRLPAGLWFLGAITLAQSPVLTPPSAIAGASSEELTGLVVSLEADRLLLADAAGKRTSYRLQPLTSLRRFGEPGAAIGEFQPGEQVRLRLRGGTVAELSDAISDQVQRKTPFRVVSQDRDQYHFTVEPIDGATGAPKGERQTLGYGKPTFLMQRENPEFVFRVAEGSRFWINRGAAPERSGPVAREVLDDASRERFGRQQRLRTLARFDAAGAPARVIAGGPIPTVQLGTDAVTWAQRLKSGARVRVSNLTTPGNARITMLAADPSGTPPILQLRDALGGLGVGEYVRVTPIREQVSFKQDVEPILQVNCLPCHGGRGASGFSISSPERLRAGGPRGKGIVAGKSGESLLYLAMSGERNPRMPPDRDATPEQLELLKRWIDAGAASEP